MKQDHGRKGVKTTPSLTLRLMENLKPIMTLTNIPLTMLVFLPLIYSCLFMLLAFQLLYAKNYMLDENWQRSRFPDSEKKIVKQ